MKNENFENFLAENTNALVFSQIAARMGISKKMMSTRFDNPQKLTVGQLSKLADVTGLSVYQLVDQILINLTSKQPCNNLLK